MNNSTVIPYPKYYYQFGLIQRLLEKVSLPYIFLIGFIGLITNTTTIVLLSKSFITKNLKTNWTLIALALSDLIFNIALLTRGIHDIFNGESHRLCIIISFLSHLAELLSACYTVAFTVQRYTAVHHPLKAAIGRHSSPIVSLLIIFILSFLFCFMLSRETAYTSCQEELKLGWFIADALFSFVIPFCLILIFNILIVNFIRQHSRSQISVQSTILRGKTKKHSKHNSKAFRQYEICFTENNTTMNPLSSFVHIEENDLIELRTKKLSHELENHIFAPSVSSSLDRMALETPTNPRISQSISRSMVSFKIKRNSSHDSLTGKTSSQSTEHELVASNMSPTRTTQSIRVTRMLVLVSTCFLILNAPAHLCVIALKIHTVIHDPTLHDSTIHINNEFHNQTKHSHEHVIEDQLAIHILYLAVLITQFISYASYSINFFLYSFSGIAFRKSLRQLIYKFRRHS